MLQVNVRIYPGADASFVTDAVAPWRFTTHERIVVTHFGADTGGRDGPSNGPPRPTEIPQQLGRYRLISELGRGSIGRLFVALDPNIDRRVALKVFAPAGHFEPDQRDDLRRRFLREARAAGGLKHSGIVAIYDAATDAASGEAYIVMELVEGPTLAAVLAERGALPWSEAVELIAQVAEALCYAHDRDLIHRDVKPGNILVDTDGRAKVTDFGIAKVPAASQTKAGETFGSPFYMSPEQISGAEVDRRSDLFSLGACLYELVTGEVPFDGDSVASIGYKVVHLDPRPPAAPSGPLPESLVEVLECALAKQPQDRFATGAEMAAALRAILAEAAHASAAEGSGAIHTTQLDMSGELTVVPQKSGRWTQFLLGVLLALAAVASTIWWLSREQVLYPREPNSREHSVEVGDPRSRSGSAREEAGRDRPSAAPSQGSPAGSAASARDLTPQAGAAAELATLLVHHRNRLRRATLSVAIDGEEIVSEEMETGKNPLRKAWGRNVVVAVPLSEGEHTVEVSVTGVEGKVSVSQSISGVFEQGESRDLRATLSPRTRKLRLNWSEAPPDTE